MIYHPSQGTLPTHGYFVLLFEIPYFVKRAMSPLLLQQCNLVDGKIILSQLITPRHKDHISRIVWWVWIRTNQPQTYEGTCSMINPKMFVTNSKHNTTAKCMQSSYTSMLGWYHLHMKLSDISIMRTSHYYVLCVYGYLTANLFPSSIPFILKYNVEEPSYLREATPSMNMVVKDVWWLGYTIFLSTWYIQQISMCDWIWNFTTCR